MKKLLLITFILGTLLLSAFTIKQYKQTSVSKVPTDKVLKSNKQNKQLAAEEEFSFLLEVGSRFNERIKLSEVQKAKSIHDLIPAKSTFNVHNYGLVKVAHYTNQGETNELGEGALFNDSQLSLLKGLKISDNFYVLANCQKLFQTESHVLDHRITQYFSIVPEEEASFSGGKESFEEALMAQINSITKDLDGDNLRPGRIRFEINESGQIGQVNMDSSCGNEEIDRILLANIGNYSAYWSPAKNQDGNYVAQTFTLFYGVEGC